MLHGTWAPKGDLTQQDPVRPVEGLIPACSQRRPNARLVYWGHPTGVTVPDEVMDALPLTGHDWHGAWNYTLRAQALASTPVPRQEDRTQPEGRAPAWLHHVVLTWPKAHEFAALLADAERYILDHPPISLHHKRARYGTLRRGPLSLPDRLLVTLIHFRWRTRKGELTRLRSAPAAAVGDAVWRSSLCSMVCGIRSQRPRSPRSQPGTWKLWSVGAMTKTEPYFPAAPFYLGLHVYVCRTDSPPLVFVLPLSSHSRIAGITSLPTEPR